MSGTFKQVEPLQIDDEIWCVLQDSAVPPVIQIEGLFTYEAALALRDWLIAATGGEGWQPIETAPKDCEILLAGQWLSGSWQVTTGQWLINRWRFVGEGQPTHWMSLPEPPK